MSLCSTLSFFSPGKVNLFLQVVGKLPDGYHEVRTSMQTIDWGDCLTFRMAEQDEFLADDPLVPSGEKNLIWQAVSLFRERTGVKHPLAISLKKTLPMEAGLGGGSSNAATTLWALSKLFSEIVADTELCEWGAALGSDIPFFFSTGRALCTGRGERVESLPPVSLPPFWIVKPPFGLSTALVYRSLGSIFSEISLIPLAEDRLSLFNDLERVAFKLSPELAKLKALLEGEIGYPTLMSGSGSAFFTFRPSLPPLPVGYRYRKVEAIYRHDDWYASSSPVADQGGSDKTRCFTAQDAAVKPDALGASFFE